MIKKIMSNSIMFSLISSVICLIVGSFAFRAFFADSVDSQLALIVEGAYGTRDYHIVESNVVLGKILALFQNIAGSIRWFSVLQLIFSFVALVTMAYILSHHVGGRFAAVVLEIAVFYELFVAISFKKTTMFCCIVAMFAIAEYILRKSGREIKCVVKFNKTSDRAVLVVSYVLLFYSALLNAKCFWMGVLISIAFIAAMLYFSPEEKSKGGLKNICIYICPVLLVSLVLIAINYGVYKSDPTWDNYRHYYNNASDSFLENEAIESVDDLNFSDEIFELEPIVLAVVALLSLALVPSKDKSRKFIMLIPEVLLCALMFVILAIGNNLDMSYAHALFIVLLVIFIGYFSISGNSGLKSAYAAIIGILTFAAIGKMITGFNDIKAADSSGKSFAVMQLYIEEEKDTLFVADEATMRDCSKYDVFASTGEDSLNNLVVMDYEDNILPLQTDILDKFGYIDCYEALTKGTDKVVLIDNYYPDDKARILTERGDGPRFVSEYIENVCGYNLYHIR